MAVITISRQTGSLGLEIAQEVAERLGYRVVLRDLINQAAQRAGAPEAALAAIDELGLLGVCPSPKACHAYQTAVREVVEELAQAGQVIIIGRGGQAILADRPGVVHVKVVAPAGLRAARIAEKRGVSLAAATAQVEVSDRFRTRYLKRFFGLGWNDPTLYDLVLNTGRLSVSEAAQLIEMTVRMKTKTSQRPSEENCLELRKDPS